MDGKLKEDKGVKAGDESVKGGGEHEMMEARYVRVLLLG